MRELIQEKIDKYERFVANLQWHIKTNEPSATEHQVVSIRIGAYNEIISDLKELLKTL